MRLRREDLRLAAGKPTRVQRRDLPNRRDVPVQFSTNGIPAGSVVRAIVVSDVRLIDSWVSLGNGQYVNTGIKGNEAYGTEFKYRRTGSTGAWASVMGSTRDNFTIGQSDKSTTSCYLRYQGVDGGRAAFSWTDTSIPHTILLKHSFNDGKGHVNAAYVDGTKVTLSFLTDKGKATTGPVGAIGTDAGDIFVGSSKTAREHRPDATASVNGIT